MKNWKEFGRLIEEELAKNPILGDPKELYEPIDYTIKLGGKRIRPALCLLSAQLFEGNLDTALKAASAVEIFHNFTLVHDDIMDEAPLRRGEPTVHKKWNRDIAILSGDVMLVKAYEALISANPKNLKEVLEHFNQTAIEVCEGQQLDMNFETTEGITLVEYLRMIELKTAVLLGCSLKIGALLSGANSEEADLIYDFGKNLGIAFQIQDDYLDAYADPEKFGKRVGGDIISNKKTYLLLLSIEKATSIQKLAIQELLEGSFSDEEKIEKMLAIYNALDIPAHSQAGMQEYYDKGMQALAKIDRNDLLKQPLIELANSLMNRIS